MPTNIYAKAADYNIKNEYLTIYVDYSKQLDYFDGDAVIWLSSDEKVVSVSKSGVIKGKNVGKATVIACNKEIVYFWHVTVKEYDTFDEVFKRDKEVLLYNEETTCFNDTIIGNQIFDDFGLVVNNRLVLDKYYSLSDRTVKYVCKFNPNSVALFESVIDYGTTYEPSTILKIDIANKTIQVGNFESRECSIFNEDDIFVVSITKQYLNYIIDIYDIINEDKYNAEFINNGVGGAGDGALGTNEKKTGMQWDYYALNVLGDETFSVRQIIVNCDECDILVYGDSITEPEAYYPKILFDKSWTQLFNKYTKKKIMTSGRCGTSVTEIMARIENELPFIKPQYCMITIGTNGGVSVGNLTDLINYIKSQGVIPILNHIPCYNNNGDSTGYISVNGIIDIVRKAESVKGCDFDKATSINGDGKCVDISKMWYETYWDNSYYYHHPNVYGSICMFLRLMIDVPELFI